MLKYINNENKTRRHDDDVSSCSSGYGSMYSSNYSRPKSCFLESILELESLPCSIAIVPSRRNKYYGFDAVSNNDFTIIKSYSHTNVTCLSKNGVVHLPMTMSNSVNFIPLLNDITLATAGNVRAYRKKSRVCWMVSTKQFTVGEQVLEPGQIFNIQSGSSILRKKQNGLRVTLFPRGKTIFIPYDRVGNFKFCASPEIRITKTVADIISNEKPPYLIYLPSSNQLSSIDNQCLYVYEKKTSQVLIAVEKREDAGKILHTIPLNLPIEVTVNSTCSNSNILNAKELQLVEDKLIKVDVEYALRHHQQCSFDELGMLPLRKASTLSLYNSIDDMNESENSILLDTTDDILKQFLKFHSPKEEKKLPSEQFFKKTGTLKRVGSFWSICEEEEINNAQVGASNSDTSEPIYEEILTKSIIINDDSSGNTDLNQTNESKNHLSLTVQTNRTTNRNHLSRFLHAISNKTMFKPRRALLPEQCKMTPRNSCPYLDFHQVDVESECMKILQELTKKRNNENKSTEQSPIKAKLLQLKEK